MIFYYNINTPSIPSIMNNYSSDIDSILTGTDSDNEQISPDMEFVNIINHTRSLITMHLTKDTQYNILLLPLLRQQLSDIFSIDYDINDIAKNSINIINAIHSKNTFPRSKHNVWIDKLFDYIRYWNENSYFNDITYQQNKNRDKNIIKKLINHNID